MFELFATRRPIWAWATWAYFTWLAQLLPSCSPITVCFVCTTLPLVITLQCWGQEKAGLTTMLDGKESSWSWKPSLLKAKPPILGCMYSAGGGYNVAVLRPRRLAGRTDYQQSRHLTPPIAPTLLLVHASLNYSTHNRMSMETCGAQWWEPRKTETWRCLNCQDDKDGVTVYLYFSSAVASPTSCGPHAQVSPREKTMPMSLLVVFCLC